MTETVRNRILDNLKIQLGEMQSGFPVLDPYTVTWSEITRENIEKLAKGKLYALGIYDTEETKSPRIYPITDCTLRVLVEFHVYVQSTKRGSSELNRVLGEIERKIREDRTLGGLAIETEFLGNEFDIDGPYDHEVMGVVTMNIKYRHHTDDPRRIV